MNKSEEKIYELLKSNVLFRDEKGIYTIFPQKLLIEASGKSERTVRYTLRSLEEQKYITREVHKKINLVKFYFSQEEELKNIHIIDRRKNCPSPSENYPSPSENYPSSSKNYPSSSENCPSYEKLPQINKTTSPDSVLYPLWKPTHEIFNDFPIGKTKKINMESEKDRRKGKTANLLMLLNFDELKGVQISRTLTIYDKNVWNSCANLIKCGCDVVTAAQIYKFMGHTSEPPTKERRKILESIQTLSRARVFISNKEEHALYEKYDEIVLDTPLLAAEICKATIGDDIVDEAVRIIEPPKLFAIAEQRGQITTIPFEVLKSPINKNDDVAMITDYLMTRISRMKNNKHIIRTILLDTLCENCKIDNSGSGRVKKHRLPDRLERILSHYKSIGWIANYKLTDREIEIIISEKK